MALSALAGALLPVRGFRPGGADGQGCARRSMLAGAAAIRPVVLSTWSHGVPANDAAWTILASGGRALDAVEAGVRVPEGDPNVTSVGYGGRPDRDGRVTLDACIMDEHGGCGSVASLEHIMHPISVARCVMEKTPHVMLVGDGALQFALDSGFPKENLLTADSEAAWREWLKTSHYEPTGSVRDHDTIGMIAIDAAGNLSGACTTSGMAFKMHGRVGDSPIIGAGLYVDNDVGAATSTGVGEETIRIVGSHLVVELMRQGRSPRDACREAIDRIARKRPEKAKTIQLAFLALSKSGEHGAFALQRGFQYALASRDAHNELFASESLYEAPNPL